MIKAEQQRDELVVGGDGAGPLYAEDRRGAVDEREPLRSDEPPLLGDIAEGACRWVRQLAQLHPL